MYGRKPGDCRPARQFSNLLRGKRRSAGRLRLSFNHLRASGEGAHLSRVSPVGDTAETREISRDEYDPGGDAPSTRSTRESLKATKHCRPELLSTRSLRDLCGGMIVSLNKRKDLVVPTAIDTPPAGPLSSATGNSPPEVVPGLDTAELHIAAFTGPEDTVMTRTSSASRFAFLVACISFASRSPGR